MIIIATHSFVPPCCPCPLCFIYRAHSRGIKEGTSLPCNVRWCEQRCSQTGGRSFAETVPKYLPRGHKMPQQSPEWCTLGLHDSLGSSSSWNIDEIHGQRHIRECASVSHSRVCKETVKQSQVILIKCHFSSCFAVMLHWRRISLNLWMVKNNVFLWVDWCRYIERHCKIYII